MPILKIDDTYIKTEQHKNAQDNGYFINRRISSSNKLDYRILFEHITPFDNRPLLVIQNIIGTKPVQCNIPGYKIRNLTEDKNESIEVETIPLNKRNKMEDFLKMLGYKKIVFWE